ncbi:MAG: TolC family protein [Gammaproteobacteria bacterium]|nr:TolC family protein [Gammaproteobacteria bacterium]
MKHIALTVLVSFFLWMTLMGNASADQATRVAIIQDGPYQRSEDFKHLLEQEIRELVGGEFDVRFPERLQRDAGWSAEGAEQAVGGALSDPEVDIVVAIDPLVSQELAQRGPLPKPSIAAIIIDADLQGLPVDDGTSGVRNLNYLAQFKNTERDVEVFRQLVSFDKLAVLVDKAIMQAMPQLEEKGRLIAKENGIDLHIAPVSDSADEALAAIPADAQAVYVTPLQRFSQLEFNKLIDGLIARRLPSFSLLGRQDVERGILASASPDTSDAKKLARRIALNVQRILFGDDPGRFKVAFSQGERLSINMETARRIGFAPTWRFLTEAELINEEPEGLERTLSLSKAVREAVTVNLDLLAFDRTVEAGLEEVKKAESVRYPQLSVDLRQTRLDEDSAKASFGARAERLTSANAFVEQLIYSDRVNANVDIQRDLQTSLEEDRDGLRLDIALEASVAYLNLLVAKTLERIETVNLKITRSNLELARNRLSIGTGNPAEVFRWESEIASDRQALIDARSVTDQAKVSVNRILDRPLEEPFSTEEATLDDPELIISQPKVFTYTRDPIVYAVFRDFMVKEALAAAPELRSLDATIAAQERTLQSAKRSFWSPDLAVAGSTTERISEGGIGADALPRDDTEIQVLFTASLSVFEGGAKRAAARQALQDLEALKTQREAIAQRIEENVRNAMQQAGASFAGIRLSREAAEAAIKNLDLVTDSYSRGVVSIIDLLDAQNAALVAEQGGANAVFDFLIDLMRVQRSVGEFDYFLSPQQKDDWIKRLEAFFQAVDVEVPLQ